MNHDTDMRRKEPGLEQMQEVYIALLFVNQCVFLLSDNQLQKSI